MLDAGYRMSKQSKDPALWRGLDMEKWSNGCKNPGLLRIQGRMNAKFKSDYVAKKDLLATDCHGLNTDKTYCFGHRTFPVGSKAACRVYSFFIRVNPRESVAEKIYLATDCLPRRNSV